RHALRNNEKPSADSGGEVDFRSAARETLSHKPGPLENERHSHGPRGEYDKTQYREVAKGLEKLYEKPGLGSQSQTVLPGREQNLVYDQKPTTLSDIIYSDFEILGQLNNSFIILQGPRGLVVVDQHIAHERVLYERFRESCQNKKVEVQMLLFPVAVEFSPQEAQLLEKHLARLKELGLELEVFGQNGFLLRTVPAMLKNDDHAVLVREIVDTLPRGDNESVLNEKYEEIVIMMSCRNAIKINQSLQSDQIRKLLYDLEQTQMPYTCPHGRPIALQFPMEDILKKFLRK
ncbi:MAG: DNA mismatch repair protein MutL, partial [Planctomycetes bacterium]|nr:DNA mismatch repair protein MutL [Planctomycetota bacterium]